MTNIQKLLKEASIAALITFILSLPILGTSMVFVDSALKIEWHILPALILAVSIFIARITFAVLKKFIPTHQTNKVVNPLSQKSQNILLIILLALALLFPFFANRSGMSIGTLSLIYIVLALGLNVIVGFAGLLVLGYAAFYAIGAYTFAILNQFYGWSFWACFPLSGIVAAFAGFLLGFPVLRLRGDYLAIVTLGFGQIILKVLENSDKITGGPDGITAIDKPSFFGLIMARTASEGSTTFSQFFNISFQNEQRLYWVYLIALGLVIFTWWFTLRLQKLPLGRAWEALREDEIACRSLGLNPTMIKLSAFTISSFFAGLAGALFATHQGSITPSSFTFLESAIILAIVVLGGMGSSLGIIIAAIFVTVLNNIQFLSEYRMLIFGAGLIIMMLWRPQGILPAERPILKLLK